MDGEIMLNKIVIHPTMLNSACWQQNSQYDCVTTFILLLMVSDEEEQLHHFLACDLGPISSFFLKTSLINTCPAHQLYLSFINLAKIKVQSILS